MASEGEKQMTPERLEELRAWMVGVRKLAEIDGREEDRLNSALIIDMIKEKMREQDKTFHPRRTE